MTEHWTCPVCGTEAQCEPGETPLYWCGRGHVTNHAVFRALSVDLDVEAARRERLREVMPCPVEAVARDD